MAIEDRRFRVDPVAYAWMACNPGTPLPKPLRPSLEGTAIVQADRRLSNPNADSRLRRDLVKEVRSTGKLWTPQDMRQLSCLAREVTAEAAATALRRSLLSVKISP